MSLNVISVPPVRNPAVGSMLTTRGALTYRNERLLNQPSMFLAPTVTLTLPFDEGGLMQVMEFSDTAAALSVAKLTPNAQNGSFS